MSACRQCLFDKPGAVESDAKESSSKMLLDGKKYVVSIDMGKIDCRSPSEFEFRTSILLLGGFLKGTSGSGFAIVLVIKKPGPNKTIKYTINLSK